MRRIGIQHRQQRGGGKAVGEDRLGFLVLAQRRTALASQHAIRRAWIEAQFLQIALEGDPLTARQGAFIARPGMVLDPLAPRPDIVGADLRAVADRILATELGTS